MPTPRATRPRILHAVSQITTGDEQAVILAMLRRANHGRFDYKILCTQKTDSLTGSAQKSDLDVDLINQKTQPSWSPYQIWRLSRVIHRLAPDLVHVHTAPLAIPVLSACRLAGVHHSLIHHPGDHTQYWADQNYLLRRWENHLTRHTDAITGVSIEVARATGRHLGIKPGRIRVIYNGIDPVDYNTHTPDPRIGWEMPPETPVVVQVSRHLETKHLDEFIDIAARVTKQWEPGQPAPAFVIIGNGPKALRKAFDQRIANTKARMPGISLWLEEDSLNTPKRLAWCQVGLLASENKDVGQVILEYIAAGLPVAAVEQPLIREIATDGIHGLLTPAHNHEALAQSVLYLLKNRHFARQLAERARTRLADFDWQRTTDAFEALYTEILARPVTD